MCPCRGGYRISGKGGRGCGGSNNNIHKWGRVREDSGVSGGALIALPVGPGAKLQPLLYICIYLA